MATQYLCRHPYTDELISVTNKEWRCIKAGLPKDVAVWKLLSYEKEYATLLCLVTERQFSPVVERWFVDMLATWPVDVTTSPSKLLAWYSYICDYFHVDALKESLEKIAVLQAQLQDIAATRKKVVYKLARQIERQIAGLRKIKANRAKLNRKKRRR